MSGRIKLTPPIEGRCEGCRCSLQTQQECHRTQWGEIIFTAQVRAFAVGFGVALVVVGLLVVWLR